MINSNPKLFLFILCFLILIFCPAKTFSEANNPDKIQEKIEENQLKINQNQKKIKQQKEKEKNVVNELLKLQRDLHYLSNKLNQTENKVQEYKTKIYYTESELIDLHAKYKDKQEFFKKRVRQIYKNKNLGFLEFLFTPKDLMTVMDYSYYFEKILKRDIKLISEMRESFTELQNKKSFLVKKRQEVTNLKGEIVQNKTEISEKDKAKKEYLALLRIQIKQFEKENAALMADSKKISQMISSKVGNAADQKGTGSFIKPTIGWISSYFGYRKHPIFKKLIFHTGIDIASNYGTEVKASDSGVVIFSGRWGGYGNVAIINHGQNISTVYAHLSRLLVNKNENIKKGIVLGYVGSTGYSTGPHLHFEIRVNGTPKNPLEYLVY